jgi:hypothetical protein
VHRFGVLIQTSNQKVEGIGKISLFSDRQYPRQLGQRD